MILFEGYCDIELYISNRLSTFVRVPLCFPLFPSCFITMRPRPTCPYHVTVQNTIIFTINFIVVLREFLNAFSFFIISFLFSLSKMSSVLQSCPSFSGVLAIYEFSFFLSAFLSLSERARQLGSRSGIAYREL